MTVSSIRTVKETVKTYGYYNTMRTDMELKVLYIAGLIDFVVLYNTLKNCLWRSISPPNFPEDPQVTY